MNNRKAVRVHQILSFSKFFNTVRKAKNNKKTKYIFFPGCALSSYNPNAVGKIIDYLEIKLNNEVGSILKCCGKPTLMIGEKEKFIERIESVKKEFDRVQAEIIIVSCQSCYDIFSKNISNQKILSLWELLPEIGIPEGKVGIGKDSDIVFNIHDSCTDRKDFSVQDGIRWVVNELGYKVEEDKEIKSQNRCCGFGRGIKKEKKGHILSYCAACAESMEYAGADSLHIVDLLFGEKYTKDKAEKRVPNLKNKWVNRYKTKLEMNKRKR